ncbi:MULTISPECIES: class I SAM-dependent methyltransferase family protein [unclassified Haladaptatus]|uniref:class I SAM-dependent methyltransferase n=1 Tax=unclassified Haladaptatus TaxID=2622732 RepID=UPI0023E8678E|nr:MULTISPECIES: class I SAM-dependent methyltransferase family protein [unclassified Haladaptatus]
MEVTCVRVPVADGEATRRALADAGVIDDDYEITVEAGFLFIPVTEKVDGYDLVSHDVPARETLTMPGDILGFEPAYERIGTIAIIDEDDADRAQKIADAIAASDLPLDTVINRASKIQGELRVRDWDILVGESTEAVHREYGCEFHLDLSKVYFSPRLATERHRVTEQAAPGERVFDMFAGVGPFVIPFAKRGCDVVGCDLNEIAVKYMRENARQNGVEDRVTAIHGDVRDVAADYEGWADRIVMNLPHTANEFLDTAVSLAGDECVLHYYDFQSDEDPFGPGERAIRDAATPEYDVTVETLHTVRSYAPHELNVCLDVRLTRA